MQSKIISIIGFAAAVLGLAYILHAKYLENENPYTIVIQLLAAALMLWSRLTFGIRSFHAAANTTEGELVTRGPYRYLRHPIYASLMYFFWACLLSHPRPDAFAAVIVITGGLFVRILMEEKFLKETYPEYPVYSLRTKRVIPFIF